MERLGDYRSSVLPIRLYPKPKTDRRGSSIWTRKNSPPPPRSRSSSVVFWRSGAARATAPVSPILPRLKHNASSARFLVNASAMAETPASPILFRSKERKVAVVFVANTPALTVRSTLNTSDPDSLLSGWIFIGRQRKQTHLSVLITVRHCSKTLRLKPVVLPILNLSPSNLVWEIFLPPCAFQKSQAYSSTKSFHGGYREATAPAPSTLF
jgi:hypothetical protein